MAAKPPNPNEQNYTNAELSPSDQMVHHISWRTPDNNSWVLHLSGLISVDNQLCVGSWLLRDHNCSFKAAAYVSIPYRPDSNMMKVILMALANALPFLTRSVGVDNLEIHASYAPLICLLSGVTVVLGSEQLRIYDECMDFIGSMRPSVTVKLVSGFDNLAAADLAKKGAQTPATLHRHFNIPPVEIAEALVLDIIGRWLPSSWLLT